MIIGVFCGSSPGVNPVYVCAARETGRYFAETAIEIVYGGGRVGLMGELADAAIASGGRVTGVITQALVQGEIAHVGLTQMHIVDTMHERKAKMATMADAFLALPGGAGTLEEIFEQWTWAQLGIHQKPCGFLNVNGYFDPIRDMVHRMTAEGFLRQEYADMLAFSERPEQLLTKFRSYRPPPRKWDPAIERIEDA